MIRVYIGIALCIVLGLGGWWLHHSGYESGVAACRAETLVSQDTARREHQKLLTAADSVQQHITRIGAATVADSIEASHETVRTIIRTVTATPAPADCVAPADSVRKLQSAVREANAAAGALRRAPASASTAAHP